MKKNNPFLTLVLLAVLSACSGPFQNDGPFGGPSAFQGSIVGRWTTGCVYSSTTEGYSVKNILFDASSAVYSERTFKNESCTGEPSSTTGPNVSEYKIVNKPRLGEAKLEIIIGGKVVVTADAVLFDDLLSLKSDQEVRYRRVAR